MSEHVTTSGDDLLRLWQETTLPTVDPQRLARSVGRIQLARFDRAIRRHDLAEYAAFVVLLLFFGAQWALGGNRVQATLALGGALFVVAYLGWHHRQLRPLDPAADGRAYQLALLERIDGQIRLLGSIRYWYLLPLYPPVLWTVAEAWRRSPAAAFVAFLVMTACYGGVAWICERSAVSRLRAERECVAALYEDVPTS